MERDSHTGYNYQSTESTERKSGMKGKGESFHHAEKEEKWMNGIQEQLRIPKHAFICERNNVNKII